MRFLYSDDEFRYFLWHAVFEITECSSVSRASGLGPEGQWSEATHSDQEYNMKNICKNCGKNFDGKPCRIFCSRKCSGINRKIKTKEQVERGEAIDYRRVKDYLLQKNGNICCICNLTKWLNKNIPLILDHIDGNHLNNKLENCRLICHNCDALLPTYKNRNKGHGRFSRRQRYINGESY